MRYISLHYSGVTDKNNMIDRAVNSLSQAIAKFVQL